MKILLYLGIALSILCVSYETAAQSEVALATRTAKLQALSEKLKKRDEHDRRQVQETARRLGIPVRRELPNDRVLELQRFIPGIGPVFYITYNVDAADTVSTDEVWPGGSAGLSLDGNGLTVGEWDAGAILANHPDLNERVTQVDGATTLSNHSTHVAGTLIGDGSGIRPDARGMAPAAYLNAYDWNSDTAEMALAAANGLLVSNHSYGIAAGWLYMGGAPPNGWWWIGGSDPTDIEDANFGYYDTETQLWDQIAFDAPYYLIVKAAGNDRWDTGPESGEQYTVIDQNGEFLSFSTLSKEPDCGTAGFDCLPTASVAKNILTVGSVDDVSGGYLPLAGPASVQISSFSSAGPTDDGRIKPDVVGNGWLLMSTYAENPYYAAALGTSMAAPNVTGSLLLLQQHYQDIHGSGNFMRAATLKALAIHTADEAGTAAGPDYLYGWGLLNTKAAAQVITEDGSGIHQIIEGSLSNGATDNLQINVSDPDAIVTVTLVWMDPPGTPPALSLNPPNLMLVNDLDLRVSLSGATHLPWVLNPASPGNAATTGDNFRDNVEQVAIDSGGSGTYSIEVSHKGALLNGAAQNYSLIISVGPPAPVSSGLLIDEDFSQGLPAGWSVETIKGVGWTIRTPLQGDARYDNGTSGAGKFAMVDVDFSNTISSLRMPAFDLSTTQSLTLHFKSYYPYFDTFDTLNVDVSTDGGTGWVNVWQWYGFNPFPTTYVLDLTTQTVGHANVILRFRFDSGGFRGGDLWQIDDVEVETFGGTPPPPPPEEQLPGQADNPTPTNGGSELGLNDTLSWSAGSQATSHNVYFGTDITPDSGELQGNQTGNSFDPGALAYITTYYWRIDEVNGDGTTQGTTWSFTTAAAPPETMNLASLTGSMIPESRGRWTAEVEINVEDQGNNPESGVTVEGNWSNGTNGSMSCITTGGSCTVQKTRLKNQVTSVTFTVNNLTKDGLIYSAADNVGGDSITVGQSGANKTPVAANDSYQTVVDTTVNGNVIGNDDQGDGPASANVVTFPSNGSLSLADDGAFTFASSFEGSDSFTYNITDQDGDISNTATVSITVSTEPEPPPSGEPSVSALPYKVKGVQHVELTWQNFSGIYVNISRDDNTLAPPSISNDGSHVDNIGTKGGGTYDYLVCETGTSICANVSVGF